MNFVLTKSNYLLGIQCEKILWINANQKGKRREVTIVEKYNQMEGIKVGEYAKKLYPNGINVPIDDYTENIQKTKELLKEKKTLFEAGFEVNNCMVRVDILKPIGDKWDIIEVKSSKKVKDINIHDVAFQKYVLKLCNLDIRKCFLLHLNDDYIRKGEIDVDRLFKKTDISFKVNKIKTETEKNINSFFNIIKLQNPPKAGILSKPLLKDRIHNCCTDGCLEIKENSVFLLIHGRENAIKLHKKGISDINKIPENFNLAKRQKIQRKSTINGEEHKDLDEIKKFLKSLEYPYYYLDFETFTTAIPMFDGIKPHMQVPFQFSLHFVEKEGAEAKHIEYLYDGNYDPRKEFLLELQKVLGDKGSVIVYNKQFEVGRLNELADYFPEHKRWINTINDRIEDLLVPFRKFSYYHPKQQGSASIKAVYNAMTGKSYDVLEIKDGKTASIKFYNATYEYCKEEEKQEIRENLLKYCKVDTLAEVLIIEKLKELIA